MSQEVKVIEIQYAIVHGNRELIRLMDKCSLHTILPLPIGDIMIGAAEILPAKLRIFLYLLYRTFHKLMSLRAAALGFRRRGNLLLS